jgi:hypothetical protein
MFDTHYEYKQCGKKKMDGLVIHLFRFKIERRTILVEVEYFAKHPIAIIKFYDKVHRHSENRFNLLTEKGKFQPILRTCLNIMIDLFYQNPYLSFGFAGAQTPIERKEDKKENTIRFRLYTYAIQQLFSNTAFLHLSVESCSHYFLINRDYCDNNPMHQGEILATIRKTYPGEALWEDPAISTLL